MKPIPRASRSTQQGIALFDGLIATVIFSIGVLAIVKLQGDSIGYTSDAKLRNQAAMFADMVIAQMWASDPQTLATNFTGSGGAGGASYMKWVQYSVAASGTGLPGVTATANTPTISVASGNLVTVTVNWQAPSDSTLHSYVSVTQINP